ncbi:MAG: 2-succinyl-5-enolpyruvyl-6-hydroxy-3-cyclohexene-1-carboxylic-acid synthase, partial [Propionibacteriaceae bacterium]
VQLNLQLDEPLVSEPLTLPEEPISPAIAAPTQPPLALTATPDLVMLLGDAPPGVGRHYAELGRAASIPVLAEPSSNGRIPGTIQCYDLLLDSPLAKDINRVIVVGRPTLSRPQRRLLSDLRFEVIQVGPCSIPERFPATRLRAEAITLAPLADQRWLARWHEADHVAARQVATLAARTPLNGWGLAACVLDHLTTQDNLMWGSSRLVRDAAESPLSDHLAFCYANRGLAGIDGLISTAMGLALGSCRPTTLVLGDLSALHDLNALALPTAESVPDLRIVVGNDDGGAIFSTLEQSALPSTSFERLFGLPHGRSLSAISDALGIPSCRVTSHDELASVLAHPISGIELIDVVLSRSQRREQVAGLRGLCT